MASRHQPGVRWTRGWPLPPPVPRAERHRGWAFPRDKEGVKIREGVGCCDGESLYTGRREGTSTRAVAHLSSEPLFPFLLFSFIFLFFPPFLSFLLFFSSLCLPLSCIGPLTTRLGVWAWRSCKNGETFRSFVSSYRWSKKFYFLNVECKFKLLKYQALILI